MKHHAPIARRPGRFREECFSLFLRACVLFASLLTRSIAAEPPRVDLFGDPLPERAIARMGTVRFRVDIPTPMPRYSPDGKQIACMGLVWTGSEPNQIQIIDSATGRQSQRLGGAKAGIRDFYWSPDSYTAAVASMSTGDKARLSDFCWSADSRRIAAIDSHKLLVWDVATGKRLQRISAHFDLWWPTPLSNLAWLPNVDSIAVTDRDGYVHLCDLSLARFRKAFETGIEAPTALAVSPDGKRLAIGSKDEVAVWDVASEKRLWRKRPTAELFYRLVFVGAGELLAAPYGENEIVLWETATGQKRTTLRDERFKDILDVAASRDGRFIAGKSIWYGACVWDVDSRACVQWLDQDGFHLDFSPDGRTLASANYRITRFDVASGQETSIASAHKSHAHSVAVTPDGKTAISVGEDEAIRYWNIASGRQIKTHAGRLPMALLPDGKRLVFRDAEQLVVFDMATETVVQRLDVGEIYSLAVSTSGATVAVSGRKNGVRLFNLVDGQSTIVHPTHFAPEMAFSPDGKTLVWTRYHEDGLQMWDIDRQAEAPAVDWRASYLSALVFSPDGTQLALSERGPSGAADLNSARLTIGRIKDGKRDWTMGKFGWLSATAISPDGTLIATANNPAGSAVARDRAMIQVRDFRTGKLLFHLRGHTGIIRSLAFTPDGAKLISASQDTTLLVWDVRPGD